MKEKIIQHCFKTFIGRIEFKFVLFLFYTTPLYIKILSGLKNAILTSHLITIQILHVMELQIVFINEFKRLG